MLGQESDVDDAMLARPALYDAIKGLPLKSTAFLPFGTFLAPAIWLGWLAEALIG